MLYLIHQTNTNAYKIGYTTNLDSRMNQYRTSMAYFEFIGTKEGSMEDEEEYHKRLIEYRINKSEWFELPDKIIEVIIKEVLEATSKWKTIANEIGIPRSEQELMEKAFHIY